MKHWEIEIFLYAQLKEIAKGKVVLDVGGGSEYSKWLSEYKDLFKDCDYKTIDIFPEFNPTILGDIHTIDLPDNSIDSIICNAVLEHCYNPNLAVDQMYRILKPNGRILASAPFIYAYHGNNIYKDYYRFTKDGWKYLFRNFKDLEIVNIRGNSETMLHFLPPLIRRCKPLQGLCRVIDKRLSNNQVSGYFVYARKA